MKHPFDENQLDDFLRQHQPTAPVAKDDEKLRLRYAISAKSAKTFWPIISAIAAVVLMTVILNMPSPLAPPQEDDETYLVELFDELSDDAVDDEDEDSLHELLDNFDA